MRARAMKDRRSDIVHCRPLYPGRSLLSSYRKRAAAERDKARFASARENGFFVRRAMHYLRAYRSSAVTRSPFARSRRFRRTTDKGKFLSRKLAAQTVLRVFARNSYESRGGGQICRIRTRVIRLTRVGFANGGRRHARSPRIQSIPGGNYSVRTYVSNDDRRYLCDQKYHLR